MSGVIAPTRSSGPIDLVEHRHHGRLRAVRAVERHVIGVEEEGEEAGGGGGLVAHLSDVGGVRRGARHRAAARGDELHVLDLLRLVVLEDLEVFRLEVGDGHAALGEVGVDAHEVGARAKAGHLIAGLLGGNRERGRDDGDQRKPDSHDPNLQVRPHSHLPNSAFNLSLSRALKIHRQRVRVSQAIASSRTALMTNATTGYCSVSRLKPDDEDVFQEARGPVGERAPGSC